jgi:hypothetical protein
MNIRKSGRRDERTREKESKIEIKKLRKREGERSGRVRCTKKDK